MSDVTDPGPAPAAAAAPVGAPLVVVPFGPRLVGAVGGAIRAAKADDPLAPVTVVMPSSHAAVSVRRHLARLIDPAGRTGLVNVNWWSLPQIAAALAAADPSPSAPVLQPLIRRAAIRAVLDAAPGRFAAVAGNAATQRSIERTLDELRDLDDEALDQLAKVGDRARDLVRIHRQVRDRCAAFEDEHDRYRRAVAVADDPDAERSAAVGRLLGPVVVVAPRRLSAVDEQLIAALARRRAVTVLFGVTGDPAADRATDDAVARLAARLHTTPVRVRTDETTPDGTSPVRARDEGLADARFVRAPDPEEEVRIAVRHVQQAIDAGLSPDDIAIVSRVPGAYDVLAHELLNVAGVPHHAPSAFTLAQSVAARVLLGFVGVVESDFRRATITRWLRSAPIRARGGAPLPSLDRIGRRAGVAGGRDQWTRRLDQLEDRERRRATEREAWRQATAPDASDSGEPAPVPRPSREEQELQRIADVRDFIDWLGERAEGPEESTWAAHASWALQLLHDLIGGARRVVAWPEADRDAFDDVRDVIQSLGSLDGIDPAVDVGRFVAVLAQELDRPAPPVGSFGHGVFVGRVHELVGARHELVIVVGMAEGSFPPKGQQDPLLPDTERRVLGGALADRRPSRADEQRDLLAALAAAPRHVYSFARVDAKGQRESLPARAFVRLLGDALGHHVGVDDLDHLAGTGTGDAPLFDVPSFQVGLATASPPLSEQEVVARVLLAHGGPPAGDSTGDGTGVPELDRGIAAVRARSDGGFSEWSGFAGAEHTPRFTDEHVGSATSFEQWATCPFRYFLSHVLNVKPLDRFADADAISGLDRGSLVHEVLESFIGDRLYRPSGEAWDDEDVAAMRAIMDDVAARFEREGRTGRPLLWQLGLDGLGRILEGVLAVDTLDRGERSLEPVAVEYAFGGPDGPPPMAFALDNGRQVSFRGSIDRIDRDPLTGRLAVIDYKTGKSDRYRDVDEDITSRGRHLQLVIYGETARRDAELLARARDEQVGPLPPAEPGTLPFPSGDGSPADVEASYWFVEQKDGRERIGRRIGDAERARFHEVLGVIVDGIEAGHFPANPGELGFFNFANCSFCDFDRVCPRDRDDQWERVRLSGALARYVQLTEPDRVDEAGSEEEG